MRSILAHPLLVAVLLTASSTAWADDLDQVELEPATVDLGRVAPQTVTTREVVVRNRSASSLMISGVEADCGCTTSEVEDPELAPGEATALMLSFDSRNYSGTIRRNVQVHTTLGTKRLPIQVIVAPYADWDITPSPVMIAPSTVGQAAIGRVTLTRHGDGTTLLTGASTSHAWLEAKLSRADGHDAYTVALRKSP
ncbi:MAG TPA: DUF1573 domain-containing protein, partial [Candidatus Synoicihabitans sp.]|nr:DUF1573 domain-containing protein [Candidatus Synoicihabitans sp.]